MVIAHNLSAMNTQRQFNTVGTSKKRSTEKLSSGYKINRSADDAAGLSISEKMRKQIRGLTQASDNCQDGVSLCQVADGALAETQDMLQRMTQLSVKAANGTLSDSDRDDIQKEVNQIKDEINRISTTTKFNEVYPLRGNEINIGNQGAIDSSRVRIDELGNMWCIPDDIKEYDVELTITDACTIDGIQYNPGDKTTATYVGRHVSGEKYHLFMDSDISMGLKDETNFDTEFYSLSVEKLKVDSDGMIYYSSYAGTDKYPFEEPPKSWGIGPKHYITSNPLSMEAWKAEPYESASKGNFVNLSDINISIHAGADSDITNKINIHTVDASAKALGIDNINLSTEKEATSAIDDVGKALQAVSGYRSYFGAMQNRMEHTIANLDNIVENTTEAESRVRDTDMAKEMVEFSKSNILEQAITSMTSQANQSTQGVLSLLQ